MTHGARVVTDHDFERRARNVQLRGLLLLATGTACLPLPDALPPRFRCLCARDLVSNPGRERPYVYAITSATFSVR